MLTHFFSTVPTGLSLLATIDPAMNDWAIVGCPYGTFSIAQERRIVAAMNKVVYSCPFVPAEWIAAHGFQPSRIMPHAASDPSAGMCPYAASFVNEVMSIGAADAVVMTTVCDQMRRVAELVDRDCRAPIFLMHVPATWETAAAHRFYVSELERLGRFLERLGGTPPSANALAAVMDEYDSMRAKLRAARGSLTARRYAEALAAFHRDGTVEVDGSAPSEPRSGVPLALVGGPLLAHHLDLFDLVEAAGGQIVLDASTSGDRTMPALFDQRRLADDPLLELADAYFGSIPDAFRRPNSELYRWLHNELEQRGVRGIVFQHYTWCDTWHAEAQRMREWAAVPMLILDADDSAVIEGHTVSRIESFLEIFG